MSPAPFPEMTGHARPFADGFGVRVRPEAGGGELEELRFDERLASSSGFESALRERAARLANFRHACYARVRRVDTTEGRLSLVSEVPPGPRLARILQVAARHHLVLDINAALCLVRQLVPAIAILHQNARDVSHGALAPERVVLTGSARVVLTEYVLGGAVEQLQLNRRRLWTDLRVAIPADTPRSGLDHRADVLQLGLIALALVLGRPLDDEELGTLPALLASATENSSYGKREPISDPLRRWLARALQLDPRGSFESALEAQLALDNVLSDESGYIAAPIALETFLVRYEECASAEPPADPDRESAELPPEAVPPAKPLAAETAAASQPDPPATRASARPPAPRESATAKGAAPGHGGAPPPAPPAETRSAPYVPRPRRRSAPLPQPPAPIQPVAPPSPMLESSEESAASDVVAQTVQPLAAETRPGSEAQSGPALTAAPAEPEPPAAGPVNSPARPGLLLTAADPSGDSDAADPSSGVHPRWRSLALGLALVVLAQGGIIFWKYGDSLQVLPVTRGTLKVESNPSGAAVRLDGEDRGQTPLSISVSAGAHVLEVAAGGEPRVLPLTIEAGQTFAQYVELAGSALTTGRIEVSSEPAGAAVLLNGRPRGHAPVDLSDVPPGEHDLVLALNGERVSRAVTVTAGSVTRVAVPLRAGAQVPTTGWVAFRVPYEMQVLEGGRPIGTTTGRLPLAPGPHQLDIVSETLAFRTRVQVNVALGRVSRVPIPLPTGVMHIEAIPQAEVWIDGEKVGETPLRDLPVTIGPHEILFRHADLGQRHHAATVTTGEPVHVRVDLTRR